MNGKYRKEKHSRKPVQLHARPLRPVDPRETGNVSDSQLVADDPGSAAVFLAAGGRRLGAGGRVVVALFFAESRLEDLVEALSLVGGGC